MRFDGKTAELYLDGRQVARQAVTRRPRMPTRAGPLSFGAALWDGGEIGCDGLVDDVRISDTLRPITGVPQTALTADEHTVGLWSFDKYAKGKGILDASRRANHLAIDTRSLDDIDCESYKAGPSPLDSKAEEVPLEEGAMETPAAAPPVSLDGPWQLVEGGAAETRLRGDWNRPMAAVVPGSVHTALVQAGVIPHPFVGRNQELARPWSFKTYWYKKTFPRPPQGQDRTLVFHGVCNRCTIWLNGKEMGQHEGMFTRIEYHTPIFNTAQDLNRQTRMSQFFTAGQTLERFVVGTQLAQAVGVRHALERARTRWPDCTGALYYKLNDNSPAASWSTVDWYGVPNISHYLIRDSFAPLVAVTLFPRATTYGQPLTLPVFLLDDADVLRDTPWQVVVRAYGATLKPLEETRFTGRGSIKQVTRLGDFSLTAEQTKTTPLLVVTDVLQDRKPVGRNYYFTNFEPVKDCLFNLPKTKLALQL
jgi:hypothetical protein